MEFCFEESVDNSKTDELVTAYCDIIDPFLIIPLPCGVMRTQDPNSSLDCRNEQ